MGDFNSQTISNNGVLDFKPQTWCLVFLFPKQCGHPEGVLTKSVKAWCSIEVVSVASGIFPVNFRAKCVL